MRLFFYLRLSPLHAFLLYFASLLVLQILPAGAFQNSFLVKPSSSIRFQRTRHLVSANMSSQSQLKILCYGDSLTAGTSPPLNELHPYGPYLEHSLQKKIPNVSPPLVRWKGYPGRTAMSMASSLNGPDGLRTLIRSVRNRTGASPDLCVIMAGTNDLAYESEADPIFKAISSLHSASHMEGVPTLAIGIPSSAWQQVDSCAAAVALEVNASLQSWCESTTGRKDVLVQSTFIPCPIDASTVGGTLWSIDGLHFSPDGFRLLGERLAPVVTKILTGMTEKV